MSMVSVWLNIQSALATPGKLRPSCTWPPMGPDSTEQVRAEEMPSSAAMLPRPEGMPLPMLTMTPGVSSMAARRAMTLRRFRGSALVALPESLISPESSGRYFVVA